jgi:hypothetical protein
MTYMLDRLIRPRLALVAIECKLGTAVTASQLTGLRSFASIAHKASRRYVVYLGERRQAMGDGIEAVPYGEFLRKTMPELM